MTHDMPGSCWLRESFVAVLPDSAVIPPLLENHQNSATKLVCWHKASASTDGTKTSYSCCFFLVPKHTPGKREVPCRTWTKIRTMWMKSQKAKRKVGTCSVNFPDGHHQESSLRVEVGEGHSHYGTMHGMKHSTLGIRG